jgi:hypothetical protein
MPVNPLWLEHTEKAAWDTVKTLRQQIEAERARVELLVKMQENWPKLLEVLDQVQTQHAVSGVQPSEVVERLGAELERVKREHAELVEKLQSDERQRQLRAAAAHVESSPPASEQTWGSLSRFLELVREHAVHSARQPRRSYDRLLDALEAKLEDLEQATKSELREHAVEIAYLAFRLAQCSRAAPEVDDSY